MACSAARLRAAAYRSAGERSSVIVLSSVPGATDNGTIIIRISGRIGISARRPASVQRVTAERERPGTPRGRPGRVHVPSGGQVTSS
ncbi:hypothetical protein GCM10010378_18150 [Streptomyces viridochromogenes]